MLTKCKNVHFDKKFEKSEIPYTNVGIENNKKFLNVDFFYRKSSTIPKMFFVHRLGESCPLKRDKAEKGI